MPYRNTIDTPRVRARMRTERLRWKNLYRVRTGDILLFSGWESVQSMIKLATGAKWNHVGIAVWLDFSRTNTLSDAPTIVQAYSETASLYVYESNNDFQLDFILNTTKDGVRLAPIGIYDHTQERIAVRRLKFTRTPQFYADFWQFMVKNVYRSYESSTLSLFGSTIRHSIQDRSSTVFCSELVAEYLYEFNILDEEHEEEHDPITFLPKDFAEEHPNELVPRTIFDDENSQVDIVLYPENAFSILPFLIVGFILAAYAIYFLWCTTPYMWKTGRFPVKWMIH